MKGIKQYKHKIISVVRFANICLSQFHLRKLLSSANTCLVSLSTGICATLLFSTVLDTKLLMSLAAAVGALSYRTIFALPALMFLIGVTWASSSYKEQFDQMLPFDVEGQTIQISGALLDIPDISDQRTRFDFFINQAATVDGKTITELKNRKIVLSCYRCQLQFEPLQEWQLFVRLKRPHSYASWGAFDYEKYLFRHKVIATGYIRVDEDNQLLTEKKYDTRHFSVNRLRWGVRNYLNENIEKNTTARAILAALMIGDKSQLSQEQNLVFQKVGINHLMAISGLHIGLAFFAAIFILKLCFSPFALIYNWVPRQRLVLLPALFVAFFYAALAGFAISTQRAIIMLSIYVLIRLLRHEASLFKVLLLAVFVIFIYDPFAILDIGFWLSCSAVFVIGLQSNSRSMNSKGEIENQNISLLRLQPMLWLSMLPLTLLFFGTVSLISPLVNLLLVPLFCTILIPLTLLALVVLMLGLPSLCLSLINLLIVIYEWGYSGLTLISELNFAQLALPPMLLIDWILFILLGIAFYFSLPHRRWYVFVFLVSFFVVNKNPSLDSDDYNVALLDVGQGLAMVVETKDSVLVYDTGPAYASGFSTARAVLIPYLYHRGIKRIDTLIISHADNDHIGGLSVLINEFPVGEIFTSRVDEIPQARLCTKGQSWSNNGIRFSILSPDQATPSGSNNLSCVLKISNGWVDTLITGDIEKPVEDHLLNQAIDLGSDILLVPHQGSKTSSTQAFINAVNPKVALIAAGYRNHYGHPHPLVEKRYIESGIELYSTIDSGTILLNIKGNSISSQSYRIVNKGFWHRLKKAT